MPTKIPLYLSIAFFAVSSVAAFGQATEETAAPQSAPQAVQPAQAAPAAVPAQPAPAPVAQPAPAAVPAQPAQQPQPAQPAPTTAPVQPAAQPAPATAPVQPAAQPAPTTAPAQPAQTTAQADSATAPQPAGKTAFTPEPNPAPAPATQPAPAPQASAPAMQPAPPQQSYVQGYGKPPQGFFGYYGYAPCEQKECACANDNAEPTLKKKKKKKAQEPEDEEAEEPEKKKKSKILHSFHVSIPIESEQYNFKKDHFDADASHFGVGGSWNRIRLDESLYSSVVGIGVNHVTTELDGGGSENLKYGGIDVNLKFGFGFAPSRDKFILAFHVFFAFDYKMQQAIFKQDLKDLIQEDLYAASNDPSFTDFGALDGIDLTYKLTHTMHVLDIQLGGDLILGYQVTDYFGFMAGVDISSNMFGGGVLLSKSEAPDALDYLNGFGSYNGNNNYEEDYFDRDDDISPILYHVTGINIVPRVGIFFAF